MSVFEEIARVIYETNFPCKWEDVPEHDKPIWIEEAVAVAKFISDRYEIDICDP